MISEMAQRDIVLTGCDRVIARLEAEMVRADADRDAVISDGHANGWHEFWRASFRARAKLQVAQALRAGVLEVFQ